MALIYLLQGHVDEAIKWGKNALSEAEHFYDQKSQEVCELALFVFRRYLFLFAAYMHMHAEYCCVCV